MSEPEKPREQEEYWWAPWAVLIGLVLYGLLGFLGVLTPRRDGPTAADVPVPPASAAPTRTLPTPASARPSPTPPAQH